MPGVIEQSLYVVRAGESFPLGSDQSGWKPPSWVSNPHTWSSKLGFVGIAPSGGVPKGGSYSSEHAWDSGPTIIDGMNTAGVSIGALWMAPGTTYPPANSTSYPEISFLDFPAWVLGNFATAGAVSAALGSADGAVPQVTVVGPPYTSSSYVPLHYIVTDDAGASTVVEFVGGQTNVYPSPNGVLANAPAYDWQLGNVWNYENLTPIGTPTSTSGAGVPTGSNLTGLPGDPMSASRFIKGWYLAQGYNLLPPDGDGWLPAPGGPEPPGGYPPGYAYSEQTAVTTALQLVQLCMGTPYGMLIEVADGDDPTSYTYSDFTMWTTVRDHTNLNYYFMPAFSGVLTKIDLGAIHFDTAPSYPGNLTVPVLPQGGAPWYADATNLLAPASN